MPSPSEEAKKLTLKKKEIKEKIKVKTSDIKDLQKKLKQVGKK